MSWSNLCDYVNYDEFHQLARRCSVHGDTVHFGYSMNWVHSVFGVNIIDYSGPKMAECRSNLIKASNEAALSFYKQFGWDTFLRSPPQNPISTTAHYGLELQFFQKWTEYFFGLAKRHGPYHAGNLESAMGSPLSSTGGSTIAFTWTYDPDIRFNNLSSWGELVTK